MQTTEVVAVSTNVEFSHTSCMFFYVMIINAHGKLFCHSSEFEKFKFVSVNKFEEVFSQIFFWPFSLRICICLFCFVFFFLFGFIIAFTKWRFVLLYTHTTFFSTVFIFWVGFDGWQIFPLKCQCSFFHYIFHFAFTFIKNGHITQLLLINTLLGHCKIFYENIIFSFCHKGLMNAKTNGWSVIWPMKYLRNVKKRNGKGE